MRCLVLCIALLTGCCTRPWKPTLPPVRVVWASGEGELRLAHDESFAILETSERLADGDVFMYDGKVYRVIRDCGSKDFRFGYLLEGE